MTTKEQRIYHKITGEAAHDAIMESYKTALKIVDGVWIDILKSMRDEINEILSRKEHEQ